MSLSALRPLATGDVKLGRPLPWAIYNSKRQLLLREGSVIESSSQLELMLSSGLFRRPDVQGADPFIDEPGSIADVIDTRTPANSIALSRRKSQPAETITMPFAETGLQPGVAIQLGKDYADAEHHYVRLVGFMEKKSLITSHPDLHGQLLFIKDGTSFHCKAFQGKRVFHFHASALRSQLQPYPYLHLNYPEQVNSQAIRGSHRIRTNIIGTLRQGEESWPCTIRDLGLNGLQIHLPRRDCVQGNEITIGFRLEIDGEKILFEIPSVVRRAQQFMSDGGFDSLELGIEFGEVPVEKTAATGDSPLPESIGEFGVDGIASAWISTGAPCFFHDTRNKKRRTHVRRFSLRLFSPSIPERNRRGRSRPTLRSAYSNS